MDFMDRLLDKIESEFDLFGSSIVIGGLNDGNSIAVRRIPSPPRNRFMDGNRTEEYGVQLLVKHRDGRIATSTTQEISDLLETLEELSSNDGSFSFVKMECTTLPNWVETTNGKEQVYTALFVAELYRTREVI
ncbi:phage tail terminator protein [Paenisporosarcina sp. TG-14]|uniref:phage tail terminator protein n=1 Tax=Paenisporosarcina sp. TG-14 TaxID=1231057 RepID=UPI0002F6F34F|nr:hypothetical protein [Paenisporosarcina sp. TG-14]